MGYLFSQSCAAVCLVSAVAAQSLGDAVPGEKLWAQCQACHQLGADAKDGVGPHLNGIFGRTAGVNPGFRYSSPMQRAGGDGLVWTDETLDVFLENPKALVSGTKMNFRGMANAQDRTDLVAFLNQYSDLPSDMQESRLSGQQGEPALSPQILAITGDPAFGEYLASECTTCHQTSGKMSGIPAITGWPEDDFIAAMHGYKARLRPHPVMQMMAGRLADEEIAALAAYFTTLGD